MTTDTATIDGNEAAGYVAYHLNEVIAIYPITPSSAMGEWADSWSARGIKNVWGSVPTVSELQSEGGAAGTIHGALQAGALATTFTASQGLLLMIPNMYKIAGELTSTVFHVAARTIATHALSIFGDHSDVMACRQTGFAMLVSNNVQEVMDFSLIAQAATLESRLPFLHIFDGFRTSHEIKKINRLSPEQLRSFIDERKVIAHRNRALTPDAPVVRGTAQNPDVFFQSREASNPFYDKAPTIVQNTFDRFAKQFGRQYGLFEYVGDPKAERIVILMGSGAETVEEAVTFLNETSDEKVGLIKVRLFRPFSTEHFLKTLPNTVKSIAVLDRTKEPGALGEPLYQDVITSLMEAKQLGKWQAKDFPTVVGGRYGLSSKEFTPGMVKGIFDELKREHPKTHFTIGISDDVTKLSLDYPAFLATDQASSFRGIFYGLGSDGTVSAAKNSITIISEETDNYVQGYFVYDSKKAGSITESHLRFGEKQIQATYLIQDADFIGCHQYNFLEKFDLLTDAKNGATFLLNSPFGNNEVWNELPKTVQETILSKQLKFYVVDAYKVAKEAGLGHRINTIMQTCFFAIAGVIPKEMAIEKIKDSIKKTFGKRGEEIVQSNFRAVDAALSHLHEVKIPQKADGKDKRIGPNLSAAPNFVKQTTAKMLVGQGDELPVSALPVDGTYPPDTTKWEKRQIAQEIPVWDTDVCIQCNKCAIVCPHAVIRIKAYPEEMAKEAPPTFKHVPYRGKDFPANTAYSIQVAPDDCTGCELCAVVCPAKNKSQVGLKALNMSPISPIHDQEAVNWDFFEKIPYTKVKDLKANTVKSTQFLQPLFEFSGACVGCGETPYIKLVTQLFGERMLVANATGCSSIYGGNLPTTPWATNEQGRGPTWSNSLFEDNAEFGAGFRLAIDAKMAQARYLLQGLMQKVGAELSMEIANADQGDEAGIFEQRERVERLKTTLKELNTPEANLLLSVCDYLVRKTVWLIGGDGWAYDIGYGGLDHILASNLNVNILVLDTEVYSNTGGQMSKATPQAAVAKFAAKGKSDAKKDLGLLAISYGHVYVAKIAVGANDAQTVKAVLEAEHYDGPSLIIAYSPCIAHGYNLKDSLKHSKLAVDSGYWPLFRFNPKLAKIGENPLKLDSKGPVIALKDFIYTEARFKLLPKIDPKRADELLKEAQANIHTSWQRYQQLAQTSPKEGNKT